MKHGHYFKPIPAGMTHIDVYAVLNLFKVTDPCRQHAIKKLLCAGQRGAKDAAKDDQEVIDTMERKLALDAEFLERMHPVVAEDRDAGVTGEKPWYPDGRIWVEVPDCEMTRPIAPNVIVSVLLMFEREGKCMVSSRYLEAGKFSWDIPFNHGSRIVAYTLDEPEAKEKPWYPDDRHWIEVPDYLMESPLAYGVMCSVLNKNERSNKAYASLMSNSCDPDWSLHPSHPIRIVAYTLEEPEDKEKPWYPDDRHWIEVPDDCMTSPLASGEKCSILNKNERGNKDHIELFDFYPEDWWGESIGAPDRIVAYTTEAHHGR